MSGIRKVLLAAVLFAIAIMLLGCIGGDNKTNQNGSGNGSDHGSNSSNNQSQQINIITDQQKNQTVEANSTNPDSTNQNQSGAGNQTIREIEYVEQPNATLGIYFIAINGSSQSNAILIKKGDLDILVDAGPKETAGMVVDFLTSHSVDDVDVLISTCADPRNYGGLEAVAGRYGIEEYWWNGEGFGDPTYTDMVQKISEKSKRTRIVNEGFTKELNGITIEVLNPPALKSKRFDDINNDAVVLKITDRNFTALLTSNIQTGAQGRLMSEETGKIKAMVLQAPYYGSGTGTSNIGVFLLAVDPEKVVITGSADESAVNGGSRDPFRRLMGMMQYKIPYYENYKNGTLRLTTDGQGYDIQAARGK